MDKANEVLSKVDDAVAINVTEKSPEEIRDFCSGLSVENDIIYLVGGDGTLQRFTNAVYGLELPKVYYCAGGTGNDFVNDVGKDKLVDGMILVNEYIKNLPVVTVNDKSFHFINGVGYGIDGMCCEIADEQREKSSKPINYTMIAIKQLLFQYKRRDAEVTVDGVTHYFKNVWVCPTMNGRYIGGGMKIAPDQDRLNEERTVSVIVANGWSRLRMLMVFPKIFEGTHVKSPIVKVFTGKEISVKFTKPCAIQVDGETTKNVLSYTVTTDNL